MQSRLQKPAVKPMCFRCPICEGGTIIRVIVAHQPTEILQWVCGLCKTTFGPRWLAADWGDNPGVVLVGPEPLPYRGVEGPILSNTLELLNRRTVSKGQIMYQIIKVLISLVCASAPILCQLQELLPHNQQRSNGAPICQKAGCEIASLPISGLGKRQL